MIVLTVLGVGISMSAPLKLMANQILRSTVERHYERRSRVGRLLLPAGDEAFSVYSD